MSGKSPLTVDDVKALVIMGRTLNAAPNQQAYNALLDSLVAEAVVSLVDGATLAGEFISNAQAVGMARLIVAELALDAHRAADMYDALAA